MKNPSLSKATSAERTAGVKQRGSNNPPINNPQGYNTFDFSAKFGQTARFADIKPFYCKPEIEGNVRRLRPQHNLETFTLSGRPKNDIRMDKDFYNVPFSSIMRKTWEVLYRMPTSTEDIVYSDVDSQISGHLYTKFIANICQNIINVANDSDSDRTDWFICAFLPVVSILQDMGSGDSVIYNMGNSIPNSNLIDDIIGKWFDIVMDLRNLPADVYNVQDMSFVDSNGVKHSFNLKTGSLSELRQFVDDYKFYLTYLATMPVTDISDGGFVSLHIYYIGEA